ncbi:MAG: tetratricopeptide repeat protein, partial [Sorangiineae bacterium]|nr:tetratricopeptide repeat protein [Sorangiineae bacterium]
MRALRAVGVWVLFAGACARSSPAGAGEAGPQSTPPAAKAMKAAPSAVASSASAPAVADAPPVGGAWAEALRMERWEEAATLIDALPEASRNAPGVRYARARVAARLGEHERAVELLSELETKLPVLASEIARHRAESELEAGPFTAAAAWFDAQPGVDAALDAATAHERAGERDPARRAVDRALQALARAKRPSLARGARARALRARLAEAAGDLKLAERDRRWIAVSAPTTPEAAEVAARVTLGPAERLVRARALAEAGRVADTDAEAEALGKLPKTPARAGELLHLRALARYRARVEPKEAAQLFSRAAQTNPSDPAGELFYAARSWSRAMQDERAIKEYENLARRFPKTAHAESARYLAARLHFILGHWKQAASGYAEYLERYRGKGRYARSAEYERAVAWLAGERATEAARAFASLVKTTRDRNLAPRYRELEGVALMGAGKQRDAATRFRQVIEESPLSFPALASAARLSALGEPAPPPIAPPPGAAARAPLEIA